MSVSGEKLSAMVGSMWNKGDTISLAFAKDKGVDAEAALKELREIA